MGEVVGPRGAWEPGVAPEPAELIRAPRRSQSPGRVDLAELSLAELIWPELSPAELILAEWSAGRVDPSRVRLLPSAPLGADVANKNATPEVRGDQGQTSPSPPCQGAETGTERLETRTARSPCLTCIVVGIAVGVLRA